MHKYPQRSGYQVADRDLLAQVIAAAVERRYAGSLRAGVIATNRELKGRSRRSLASGKSTAPKEVDYATVWRAMRKRSPRLKASTFAWLRRLVGPEGKDQLDEAVISPVAQWLLTKQVAWESESLNRLAVYRRGSLLTAVLAAGRAQSGRMGELLAQMLKANPSELLRFRARTQSHRDERTQLALLSLLAPFLDAGSLEGVERRWEELRPTERKRYVRLTLRREELLLNRSSDVQRAQEIEARMMREDVSRPSKPRTPASLPTNGARRSQSAATHDTE
jgi:hypothetical protein